ncbi:MAG: hypothetical protein A2Y41_14245 [Spirochaetes bacterium GWB1_36_13]|nr:MAG: hypothetical protein A2Y41_14245 [Spirochaetes bacterium GWB1_36_13]
MNLKKNFILLFLLSSPLSIIADEIKIDLGVERNTGYTLYQIGGKIETESETGYLHFPLSELKFPVDVLSLNLDFSLPLSEKWTINGKTKTNIQQKSGKTEDSDFGIWYLSGVPGATTNSLDVFSESDTKIKKWYQIDIDINYKISIQPNYSIAFGAGFFYHSLSFEISNLNQWYPSYSQYSTYLTPSTADHYYISGVVGSYDVTYTIPYIELVPEIYLSEGLLIKGKLAFSPFVKAEDLDDHKMRSKKGEGDTKGKAFLISFQGDYSYNNIIFSINADFKSIQTDGKDVQTRYETNNEGSAGYIATTDKKLKSIQFSAGFKIGISFK